MASVTTLPTSDKQNLHQTKCNSVRKQLSFFSFILIAMPEIDPHVSGPYNNHASHSCHACLLITYLLILDRLTD